MNDPLASVKHVTEMPAMPARAVDAHKGDFGHVLIVGGSVGMAGAAALAGKAALRGGAGLVTVACPHEVAAIVAGFEPSYMTLPLWWSTTNTIDDAVTAIGQHGATVIAVGPGIGRADATGEMVPAVRGSADGVDADGPIICGHLGC